MANQRRPSDSMAVKLQWPICSSKSEQGRILPRSNSRNNHSHSSIPAKQRVFIPNPSSLTTRWAICMIWPAEIDDSNGNSAASSNPTSHRSAMTDLPYLADHLFKIWLIITTTFE
ncbi:hypothetical protein ACLOJK_012950 [Asimina triloba]